MYKKRKVKNINMKPQTNQDNIQLNIKKELEEDKKIKPEKVFEGYKSSKKNIKTKTKKQTKSRY